jgi:stage II sporulation protein D
MTKEKKAPEIKVGIVSGNEISFTLNGLFHNDSLKLTLEGSWSGRRTGSKIILQSNSRIIETENGFQLDPLDVRENTFTLHNVTIGVDFHWQRKENQVFKGSIKLIIEEDKITAVNCVSIEDYLISVISSEMSATSSKELLKAHAVTSRSWLLAQISKSKSLGKTGREYLTSFKTENEIVRWYDREEHQNYDVCADDHCQRYQGITRASREAVEEAVISTYGEVLSYEGEICDARYSKCCGGVTEQFENVWEPRKYHYLQKVIDNPLPPKGFDTDLSDNDAAKKWINGNPEAFCNTSDKSVLTQVLNDYDQETNDFFRWKVVYSSVEISEIVKSRTGIDFGTITDIIPLERGASGRIIRLRITGTKKTMIIGKELEIRKALSKTHLFSSCFFVKKLPAGDDFRFVLRGAGWGHGVGLCQIGAAVMGSKGYSYREILKHYFRDAKLEKRYAKETSE